MAKKNNSGIKNQNKKQNLKSDLVKLIACKMSSVTISTLNDMYNKLGYYLSDITEDINTLLKQGILCKVKSSQWGYYYSYSSDYYLDYATECDVLANCTDEEISNFNKILSGIKSSYNSYSYSDALKISPESLAYSISTFLRENNPANAKINHCLAIIKEAYGNYESYITKLLQYMLRTGQFAPLFASANIDTMKYLRLIATWDYLDMTLIDKDYSFIRLFFDADLNPYSELDAIIYVLQNDLFAYGHIDQIIAKYTKGELLPEYLSAIKQLHEGDTQPIIAATIKLIDRYRPEVLYNPSISMFFCGALLLDNSDTSMKIAKKFYKISNLKKEAELMHALLGWKINGKISSSELEGLEITNYNPSSMICFIPFALHYNMISSKSRPKWFDYYIEHFTKSSKMEYIRMMYSEVAKSMSPLEDSLHDITGMISFLNGGRRKEPWEFELELIMSKCGPSTSKSRSEADARVAYLVDHQMNTVQPVLQKSTNGITWTKGRNIALKSFRTANGEGITQLDIPVCRLVTESPFLYNQYVLPYEKAIPALAGHPFVFTDDKNRLKIDIVEEELQLSVQREKNGSFKLNLNIDPLKCMGNVFIDSKNPTSVRVIKIDPKKIDIVNSILRLKTLPAKAESVLVKTLTAISSKMTVMSDLLADSNVETIPGSPLIAVQLIPDGELIRMSLFAKPLVSAPPYLAPAVGSEFVSGKVDAKLVNARRDFETESANKQIIEQAMLPYANMQEDENLWSLDIESTLALLELMNNLKEHAFIEWPEGVKMRINHPQIKPWDVHVAVRKLKDWFAIDGEVKINENTSIKVQDLLHQLGNSRSRFIRINDDEYVALSQELAKLLRSLSQIAEDGKQTRLSPFNASALEALEREGVNVEGDKAYRKLIERINSASQAVIKIPRGLQADLRDYQKDGYRWLARLYQWGAGACLADDMGLGKTLQSIALLYSQRTKGPSLVVAPTSVLLNWRDEIARFAPQLNTHIINNASDKDRNSIIDNASNGDVVISSYGILVNYQEKLQAKEWNIIVLDEAHTIKNRGTKMSKAAMTLKGEMRIALTGTPLQNRLSEIWNIYQFINPGILGSFQSFSDRFIIPIERDGNKDRQRILKQLISPFILRRTKSDVLSELPEKTEITIKVDLSDQERAVYEDIRKQAELMVESGEQSPIEALAQITRLRQVACNVKLINPNMPIESSKAAAFMQLVENLHSNHHRALVFSQFTSHLALIRELLDKAGYQYLYLDGSTLGPQRAKLVEEFQQGDIPLFLISLKAGGLGLNLTAADYVIHLDPWWNPAIEDQASDRSYRIGQQKPVTVYRIIAADTIEEKIINLHMHKKSLADALLEGADMSARLTREEILNLLNPRMDL